MGVGASEQVAIGAMDPDLDLRCGSLHFAVAARVVGMAVGIEQVVKVRPVQTELAQRRSNRRLGRITRATVDQRQPGAAHQVQVDSIALIGRLDAIHPIADWRHVTMLLAISH